MDTPKIPVDPRKQLRLSRKDRLKRNPIPWIVLLVVCAILGFKFTGPDYNTWIEYKTAISGFDADLQKLEDEYQKKLAENKDLDARLDKYEQEAAIQEAQVFPEKIDVSTVVEILEIYTVLLKRGTHANAVSSLENVTVGATVPSTEGDYSETPVNLTLIIDKTNFERFVQFIQTNRIPADLKEKIMSRTAKGDSASMLFLEENHLPVLNIKTMDIKEEGNTIEGNTKSDGKTDKQHKKVSVQMQLVLFSRK